MSSANLTDAAHDRCSSRSLHRHMFLVIIVGKLVSSHMITEWKYCRERSRCSLVRKLRSQCYGFTRSIFGEKLKRIASTYCPWQLLCKGMLFQFIRSQVSFLAFGVSHSWRRRAWLSCDSGPQRSSKVRTRCWVAPKSDKSCITPHNVRFAGMKFSDVYSISKLNYVQLSMQCYFWIQLSEIRMLWWYQCICCAVFHMLVSWCSNTCHLRFDYHSAWGVPSLCADLITQSILVGRSISIRVFADTSLHCLMEHCSQITLAFDPSYLVPVSPHLTF